MHRRLLIITKDPEFDDRNEVVLGQCEPFTPGWRLIMVLSGPHGKGPEEVLINGVYSDLRRIQESCAHLEEPEDVRKRVTSMRSLMDTSGTETVLVDYGNAQGQTPIGSSRLMEPTQVMPVMPGPANEDSDASENGFFEVRSENGVLLALVADPDSATDLGRFNRELGRLMTSRPRAIVLDLSRIQNLALRAVNDFLLFRDQCAEQNISFGLCSLRKSVQKLLDNLGHDAPLQVFPSPEAAVGAIGPEAQAQ